MAQHTREQPRNAQDFNGTANAGLFEFPYNNLPIEDLVVCDLLAIHIPAASGITWVAAYFEITGHAPILVAQASAAQMLGPNLNWDLKCCPGIVPRLASGAFYQLKVYSSGLTGVGTATLAWRTGSDT